MAGYSRKHLNSTQREELVEARKGLREAMEMINRIDDYLEREELTFRVDHVEHLVDNYECERAWIESTMLETELREKVAYSDDF